MQYNFVFLFAVLLTWNVVTSISIPQYHEFQSQEQKKPPIPIIKQNFEQHHEGYQHSFETGNGIQVQEAGFIKNKGDEKHESLVQQGTITYHDEHGQPISLSYIADEHGFQPQGSHLPTPPPIPEEIAKSLHESAQPTLEHEDVGQHAELAHAVQAAEGVEGGHEEYAHY